MTATERVDVVAKERAPGALWLGALLGTGCLVLTMGALFPIVGGYAVLLWGFAQWVLVAPFALVLRARGRRRTLMGLLATAIGGVLLNIVLIVVVWNPNNTRF